jgi:alkylhydroperoxidase family enzyme
MAFIATVPPSRATGGTAEAYAYAARITGHSMVARIVQLFSLRPESMRRMLRTWELSQWSGDEPRRHRELVAAAVSRVNECHY